jgi:hypothetical protein
LITIFDGKIVFVNSGYANENNLKPAGAVISTFDDMRKAAGGSLAGGGG